MAAPSPCELTPSPSARSAQHGGADRKVFAPTLVSGPWTPPRGAPSSHRYSKTQTSGACGLMARSCAVMVRSPFWSATPLARSERGHILATASALEQAIVLARIGMSAVHEQPGNRSRSGPGADSHRDHGKRAVRRVRKREHGAAGTGRQSRSGGDGRRLMTGIPQRRTQAGDRVILVRHEQSQRRDHAQASQQGQDDRDPAAAAGLRPPVMAPRSWFERHDIRLTVHASSPATQSRLPVQARPRARTSSRWYSVQGRPLRVTLDTTGRASRAR